MAIKVKVRRSVHFFSMMAQAFGEIRSREPVARLSLRVLRNLRVIEADARAYVQRQVDFLERHAQRDEQGAYKSIPGRADVFLTVATPEAQTEAEELSQAGAEEVEYELEPIDLADLDALGGLPSSVVDALEPLIRDGDAEV